MKGGDVTVDTVKGPDSKEQRIEHMVTLYQLPLLRLCIMYLHDEEQAKDVVQETFIKAYRNLDGFRADSSEKTWLTRIAINTCKNVYRSGWFRHVDRSVTLDMVAGHPAPTDTGDNELTTEIMNLPVKLREVALLCWLHGMTYDETAATLGISPKAVGSRLNRARKKLRSALEGSDEHDPA